MSRRIRLRGINGGTEGKNWESDGILRAGRLETLEIVLDETSVSRRHAEIRATDRGWLLQDLDSTNGTFLNGIRVNTSGRLLRPRDIVQFGKVTLLVELLEEGAPAAAAPPEQITVEAAISSSWEVALQGAAFDRHLRLRPGDQLQALFRASHYLGHAEREEDLLHAVLNDAVTTLDAQRGAIILADGPEGELQLRALASGKTDQGARPQFSKSLAQRSFLSGESILCSSIGDDPEFATAQSIHELAMSSAVCVLLRTPRKRLGVLQLHRSYWQNAFTKDDLYLADALAASVSAGIEIAQLLRQQRELFFNTITALAQAVELKDKYTGGHTDRVTRYAQMLGAHLGVGPEDLELLRTGTPLHDIGKIGIKDAILSKPDRLTPEEMESMKTHTVKGAAILATIRGLATAIPIVRSHHERWDGKGYPDGLAGEAIPRLARIVAVVDAFDAMTSDRPYRRGMSCEKAFAEVEAQSGKQFDPECAAGLLAIREQIVLEMESKNPSSETTAISDADSLRPLERTLTYKPPASPAAIGR